MKISVLCFDLSNNSLARAALLARALSGQHEVEIIGPARGPEIWSPLKDMEVPVKRFDWKRYPSFASVVGRMLEAIDGDVILASKLMPTSFGIGWLKKRKTGTPLILDIDDWELGFFYHSGFFGRVGRFLNFSNPNGLPYTWLMERLTGYADAVSVSNRFLQNRFGGRLLPHCRDTSVLDPERFDADAVKETLGLKGKKVLMFLGTPRAHKGIDDLLSALGRVDDPDLRLVVIGVDDPLAFLNGVDDSVRGRVVALPKISFDRLPEHLAAADVIVIPQRRTSDSTGQMPAKLYDAMAMAKPVI
ncbi:MAG: glycosyltransferase family 4 protein, partial [Nitrospinae bacterium]|nr:glycosyltransferase family 4 protein [Nitrospinota bacterium]